MSEINIIYVIRFFHSDLSDSQGNVFKNALHSVIQGFRSRFLPVKRFLLPLLLSGGQALRFCRDCLINS